MPLPFMKPVQSSNISDIGYDVEAGALYITFRNSGRTYRYEDVTNDTFHALENADSVGSYFANNIKGQYKTVPV